MRKVMAGAVAAALLSWGHGAQAADAKQERREAADATKAEARQEGREAKESMERGADRTRAEAGKATDRARSAGGAAQDEKKHPPFEGKKNFDVDGKVTQASADRITIQRDDLPAATLHVSPNTKIELDGKQVSAQELTRGQDVKASFNLQGEKPEAVQIKAQRTGPQKDQEKDQQKDHQKELQKVLTGESR
jgi:hypothetical protein